MACYGSDPPVGGGMAVPMKVAIYTHNLSGGGAERVVLALLEPLQRLGAHVTLLLHRREGELVNMLPNTIKAVDFHTTRTVNDFMPLATYLRSERPDALLANLSHNNVIALLAKAVTRAVTRVYICQHNALSQECARSAPLDYRVIPMIYSYFAQCAAGIIAVSKGVADDLARTCHIERDRITTIYNPVIGADFASRAQETVDHPWLHGLEAFFFCATQLPNHKGQETFLHALARVPSGRLLVLGAGYKRESLEKLSDELGLH